MHPEDFIAKHGLREIERDPGGNWRGMMMEVCPIDGHDEKDVRFYVNEEMNVFLAVDEARGMVRAAYWEMVAAISEWEPIVHLQKVGAVRWREGSTDQLMAEHPLADEAEGELHELMTKGEANGWARADREALFAAFDRWLADPRLLDREDLSLLRVTVLNELTWLLDHPVIGDDAWDHLRGIAKELGREDHDGLREAWIIATFELAAEVPEVPWFLEKLFSFAGDGETRWAVFGAYENVPWRLRPHARKYAKGLITDEDVDAWLIEQERGDDEVLMGRDVPGGRCFSVSGSGVSVERGEEVPGDR
jgi:glutathione S-transferase